MRFEQFKPEIAKNKEIRRIYTHELVTVYTEKKAFDFFNDKVEIFEKYDPEKRDWQTHSLGHYKCGEMRMLKESVEQKEVKDGE